MNKNTIIVIVLGAVVIIGGAVYFSKPANKGNVITPSSSSTLPSANQTPTQSKSTTTTPSSNTKTGPVKATNTTTAAKPVISGVSMSTALTTSGAAANPTTTFSPTTPTIYAVLSLKNTTARTQLSYIRYYEGKYVDSKVSHPSTNNVKYFHFSWILKAGQTRKAGNYSLVFYVDGKKASTVNYTIR